MPKTPIVAMAGMTKCGKTTCAEYLNAAYGLHIYAFVDHLKHELQALYPELTQRDLWGAGRGERKGFLAELTPREALIEHSNECRKERPDVNVDDLLATMAKTPEAAGWVLSDCRHPTELAWAEENAVVIKLTRGARALIRSGNTGHFDWHAANHKATWTIDNQVTTLDDLFGQLDEIMDANGFQKT